MSEASEKFRKNKQKYLDAFSEAVTPIEKDQPQSKSGTFLNPLLLISLICTMLPAQIIVTFFSFTALLTASIYLILFFKGHARISRSMATLTAALVLTSILSGCSPALFSKMSPELYELIKDRKYKYHTVQKYGFFGLGLEELTIENTQFDGDIDTVYVAKLEQGYGLVSVGRVTVAGK